MEWFVVLAGIQEPNRNHLHLFLNEVQRLLTHTLESEAARGLWDIPEIREMARTAYFDNVLPVMDDLHAAIDELTDQMLIQHGLIGAAARFKYNVMAAVCDGWGDRMQHFTSLGIFRKVIEIVDIHLRSLIAAASGIGGLIEEFKDSLLVLAPNE